MVRLIRSMFAPTLAAICLLSANSVRADYTYAYVTGSATTVAGLTITGAAATPLTGSGSPVLLNFTLNGVAANLSTPFSFQETFTGTPGTETVLISGTFKTGDVGSTASNFTASSVNVISGSGYALSPTFVYYTTNVTGTTATLAASITPIGPSATVPEPASAALLGLGLAASIGVATRRRAARG